MYSLTEEARKDKQIPGKARKTDKKVRRKNLQPQPLHYAMLPAVEEDEETGEPVDVDADDEEFGLVIMKAIEENGEEILSTPDTDEELDAIYNLFMERFFEEEEEQ